MAYHEQLGDRIRALVAGEPGLTEKKHFGGLAFLLGGNMASAATAPARHAPRELGLTCILDGLTKLIAERTPSTETDGQTTSELADLRRVSKASGADSSPCRFGRERYGSRSLLTLYDCGRAG